MLSLFLGCFGLSFKKWTGFQDGRIYRIDCFKLNRSLTMDRIAGLQDLQDCYNSYHVYPENHVNPVYFLKSLHVHPENLVYPVHS